MRWISTKNGAFPTAGKDYLVTYMTKRGRKHVRIVQCIYVEESPRLILWGQKHRGTIIAYMPLQEPYKGD